MSLSPETIRLYAADWSAFLTWSRAAGCRALPADPATVAAYLTGLVPTLRPGALARRAAAIGFQHRRHGHAPPPTTDDSVTAILRDARRTATPPRPPRRTGAEHLQRMALVCPGDLAGLRDAALLLLTAASGLGRAALLGLDAEHIRFTAAGVELRLGEAGRLVAVARARAGGACPVRALEDWLRASECRFGPVFRKVDRWGNVEHRRMGTDAIRRIWRRREAALRPGR